MFVQRYSVECKRTKVSLEYYLPSFTRSFFFKIYRTPFDLPRN